MKKERIWIVSEMFYPDETSTAYIMTNIANSLAADLDVHVLCGPSGYDDLKTNYKGNPNFTIHRINAFNFNKNYVFQRLIRLLLISLGMLLHGLFKVKGNDKLLLVTNPALAIPLFSILKKIKGFSYFILVHDVFPENLIPAKILPSKNNLLYKLLTLIFDWSYRQGNHLIVLGRDMKEILTKKTHGKNSITIIENWADLEEITPEPFLQNELIIQKKLEDKIVFLFAGNLGRLQGLPFLFDIIKQVNNDLLHFAFVGDGALLPQLKETVLTNKIENVSFWGTFPRKAQSKFLNASTFGVVTLDSDVFGLGVPSKSYNILAAGKPIFFLGNKNSEIAQMISEHDCGIVFTQDEENKILDFFNQLNFNKLDSFYQKGINSRLAAKTIFSKQNSLQKFKSLINNT